MVNIIFGGQTQTIVNKINIKFTIFYCFFVLLLAQMPALALAAPDSLQNIANDSLLKTRFNIHFQTTYIYQAKPSFNSPYEGAHSLSAAAENVNSLTASLFLGLRLWKGAFFYFNPEIAGGGGLSGAYGIAASSNGETVRVGDPAPTLYLARCYLQQTFALSKETTYTPDQANQMADKTPKDYVRFYLGKFSLYDLFDVNPYASSCRTQFMNWCLMANGAWDYAANLRGYTDAFAVVLQKGSMTYKAALAAMPVVANGEKLNSDLSEEYSLNAEVDKAYTIGKKPGNIRILGYYNNGDMGNYQQAIQNQSSGIPDVISTRQYGRTKYGIGLDADQQLGANTAIFARLGWNDGQNETWCFTETDRILSAGFAINGAAWKRKDDNFAFAVDVNGLSQNHLNYLANGGLGFQLGDNKLNYADESVFEMYYNYKPDSYPLWFTADYQFVLNPGFNQDRGPVQVFSFRAHVEF